MPRPYVGGVPHAPHSGAERPYCPTGEVLPPAGEGHTALPLERALDRTFFVESPFTGGVPHPVDERGLAVHLAPYRTRDSRRPVLGWARSLPLDGQPADVAERVERYGRWLAGSHEVPELPLTFDSAPTVPIGAEMAQWCGATIAASRIRHCGPAGHHAPEDQPGAVAAAIAAWVTQHTSTGCR